MLLQIVLIPILIGLIFELVVLVPFRPSMDEIPILYIYHDWALGLVTLKIWTKLVCFYYHVYFESFNNIYI